MRKVDDEEIEIIPFVMNLPSVSNKKVKTHDK
jgi:hypothetical protein